MSVEQEGRNYAWLTDKHSAGTSAVQELSYLILTPFHSPPPPPHLPHTLPHSVIFSLPAQQEAAFCNIGERGGWGGGGGREMGEHE